jgi:hypothetical protein
VAIIVPLATAVVSSGCDAAVVGLSARAVDPIRLMHRKTMASFLKRYLP